MESSSKSSQLVDGLRLDILPPKTREAFLKCVEMPMFQSGGWYLAGGTALALQAGHRRSYDLDFFTPDKKFDGKKIEAEFVVIGDWVTSSMDWGTLYGEFAGGKISFIAYPFFRPEERPMKVGSVAILSPKDIAVMKIVAISQRGKKRDFFDLYWLCLNVEPLGAILERVEKQYSVRQNINHIFKSLVFFGDAEDDPEPEIFFKVNWKEVKKFFQKEIKIIADKLIA